jgi:hypothetical protein
MQPDVKIVQVLYGSVANVAHELHAEASDTQASVPASAAPVSDIGAASAVAAD